jgi:ferritin-like metal-binding protein YciE
MEAEEGKSQFVDILKEVYDTECRVNVLLCRMISSVRSGHLRKRMDEYMAHNGLTLGKIYILFHLMGAKIQARGNTTISHILDAFPRPSADRTAFDKRLAQVLLEILRTKIYYYTALIAQGTELGQQQAVMILNEMRNFERQTVAALNQVIRSGLNGVRKSSVPRRL